MEVTTALIQDTSRKRKTKEKVFPLAIRVTYNRVPIKFPIGIELSIQDFEKLTAPRLGEYLVAIRDKCNTEKQRANEIIKSLGTFTFQAFREEFYKNKPGKNKKGYKAPSSLQSGIAGIPTQSPSSEGKNKKYGKRKYDRIRSNVNYIALGPLAVATVNI
jgi:hypothetical protein